MKIQKGDTVKIISGKDNGNEGKVLQVFPKKNQVLNKWKILFLHLIFVDM